MLLFSTVLYRYPQRSRSQKQCENQSVPVIIKHLIPRWNSDPLVNTETATLVLYFRAPGQEIKRTKVTGVPIC